jgi:hypothetical protein
MVGSMAKKLAKGLIPEPEIDQQKQPA